MVDHLESPGKSPGKGGEKPGKSQGKVREKSGKSLGKVREFCPDISVDTLHRTAHNNSAFVSRFLRKESNYLFDHNVLPGTLYKATCLFPCSLMIKVISHKSMSSFFCKMSSV